MKQGMTLMMRFRNDGFRRCSKDSRYGVLQKIWTNGGICNEIIIWGNGRHISSRGWLFPARTAPTWKQFCWYLGPAAEDYLKIQRKPIYTALFLSGKLDNNLSEIYSRAEAMFFQLVKQLAEQEGIAEQLKADNLMECVRLLYNIRNCAEEIIYFDIICRLTTRPWQTLKLFHGLVLCRFVFPKSKIHLGSWL